MNLAGLQSKIMQFCQESEQKKEAALLKDFLAAAAAGKNAVTGMKDTLDMVNTSRVKTLIFLSGLQVSGQKCSSCGLLTTLALERCPNCNHRLEQTPDVVDLAVHEVLRKGGSVEAINTSPELEKTGSIGALLRY